MRSLRLKFGLAALIGVSLAAPGQPLSAGEQPEGAQARSLTAFTDVHVLPMDQERVLDHQTVLVSDGKIVAMGPAKDVNVPRDAQRVAAAGKWLLPGLADMHVHVDVDDDLALFIANGVTTVLHMGLAPSYVVNLDNRAIDSGKLVGPRLFFGFMIDGNGEGGRPYVSTPQQARAIVQFAKTNGYDFIKVYNSISQPEFTATVDEARLLNMAVIGHGVRAVGLPEGLRQGQVMVAHAEEFLYTAFADKTDYASIPEVARATRDTHAWVTPNLSGFASFAKQWGKPDVVTAFLRQPEVAYLSPQTRIEWSVSDYQLRRGSITEELAFLRRFTKALSDAGVPLLTGTDTPLPGLLPGYSEHDDLRELVEAGLTPYQALVAATRSAGEFIKKFVPGAEPFGVVALGMRADLVLVQQNPLGNLGVLRNPVGVMAHGRWYDAASLAKLLDDRKKHYEAVLCH